MASKSSSCVRNRNMPLKAVKALPKLTVRNLDKSPVLNPLCVLADQTGDLSALEPEEMRFVLAEVKS